MARKVILSVGAAVVGIFLVLSIVYGHIQGSLDVIDDFANVNAAGYRLVSMLCSYVALYALIGTGVALGVHSLIEQRRAQVA